MKFQSVCFLLAVILGCSFVVACKFCRSKGKFSNIFLILGLGDSSIIRAIEQVGLYELNKLENPSSVRAAYPPDTTLCYDYLGK